MGDLNFKKAFTMAEAILVMTILGIIATIMITTLKPAEFKDKGMEVLAKKVLSEIDTATTMILINNSFDGTMLKLYEPGSSKTFEFRYKDTCHHVATLYKKYLTATRQVYVNASTNRWWPNDTGAHGPEFDYYFYLKDGAWVGILCGRQEGNTRFPGETNVTGLVFPQGRITFDINGDEPPNSRVKDIFMIPIGNNGILYDED